MLYWQSIESQHALYAYLLSLGLRPGDLLADAALPRSSFIHSAAWIERDSALSLANHLSKVTSDPLLGLHQSSFYKFEEFGSWGRGVVASPTLGEALAFAAREIHILQTGTQIHYAQAGNRARVWISFEGACAHDPVLQQQAHLAVLKMILDLAEEPVDIDVSISCCSSSNGDELERAFGSRMNFHDGRNCLEFDANALGLALIARPAMTTTEVPVVSRTDWIFGRAALELVRGVICYERPNIQRISDSLGINLRMFQRHLDALGLTFRQLVDEYRQACALSDLSEGRLSITDIAFQLGYSDSAHFTRAVQRWTGCTPRALRGRPIPPDHWLNRRVSFTGSLWQNRHAALELPRIAV